MHIKICGTPTKARSWIVYEKLPITMIHTQLQGAILSTCNFYLYMHGMIYNGLKINFVDQLYPRNPRKLSHRESFYVYGTYDTGPNSHRYGWHGFHGTTFRETKSRVYVTVLFIDITHSRHSRGIYNCGATPPSVYVSLEREASTIARFPTCSSSCSFTHEIASEMSSESLE